MQRTYCHSYEGITEALYAVLSKASESINAGICHDGTMFPRFIVTFAHSQSGPTCIRLC